MPFTRSNFDGRAAVPLALAVAGWLAVGCIPVPGGYRVAEGGPRPDARIGPPGSDKLVRVGHSTREDVVYVLGPPRQVSRDGSVLVYEYSVVPTDLVLLVPFTVLPQAEPRWLRLTFDATGTLRGWKVYKDLSGFYHRLDRGGLMDYPRYQRSTGSGEGELPLPPLTEAQPHTRTGGRAAEPKRL